MGRKKSVGVIKLEECSQGKLWTVPELASFSGLSVPTINRMIEDGDLKWISIGPYGKRSRRIPHREVLKFCDIESGRDDAPGD